MVIEESALLDWRVLARHGNLQAIIPSSSPYRGFRLPAKIIEQAIWLYHCLSLSLRDVETILAARGVVLSYETVRDWGIRLGRLFANTLHRRRPRAGDKWRMDEVFIRIRGERHYLWRTVDQDRFRTTRGRERSSDSSAVSDRSMPRRERQMQRFKSARHARRFLSTLRRIHNHVQLCRDLVSARECRNVRDVAFRIWQDVVGVTPAA